LVIHLYSWLIRLYPASFRAEFEEEMMIVFNDMIEDAALLNQSHLLTIFLRELRDYPFSLLREYCRNFSHLEPNLMTIIKKPEWFFYPAWILLTTLCVPIAFLLYFAIIRVVIIFVGDFIYLNGVRHVTEDYLFPYIFIPTVGILMGVPQYGLLRNYLPRMGWWVPATAGGWLLGLVLILLGLFKTLTYFWGAEKTYTSWAIDLAFIMFGLSIGFGQWLLLRRRLPRAGWWIGANVVGWGLVGLITGDTMGQFWLIALGLLPACVTAAMLALLMNQAQPPEPQGA